MEALRRAVIRATAAVTFGLAVAAATPSALAQAMTSPVQAWVENPWTDTVGGTLLPDQQDFARPWQMIACRNDTEQVMIGLLNDGDSSLTLNVALESDLPQDRGSAELLVVGGIMARLPPNPDLVDEELERDTERYDIKGRPLMNLFTAEQIRSFEGNFPETFTNTSVIRDFPTLQLAPGESVRLWVRVRTFDVETPYSFTPAGDYSVRFRAQGENVNIERELLVKVIDQTLPVVPVIDVMTWGGLDEKDDILHHTTVRGGHKRTTFMSMIAATNNFPRNKALLEMADSDPEQFQKEVEEIVDEYLAIMREQGFTEDRILMEIYDEPRDSTAQDWVKFARAVRKYRPDLKIMANPGAHWAKRFRTIEGTFKPLAPYVDVWVPHINHYKDPETVAFLKSTGKPLGYYYNCAIQSGRREPGIVEPFRRMGWVAIKHDLQMMGFWAATAYQGDPWNDFDKRPGKNAPNWPDAAVVFPSSAGPIATRNWEAWRECVEDVAIYRMIHRAHESGVFPVEKQEAVEKWLAETPDRVLGQTLTAKTIEQVRQEGLSLLEALD